MVEGEREVVTKVILKAEVYCNAYQENEPVHPMIRVPSVGRCGKGVNGSNSILCTKMGWIRRTMAEVGK